MHLNWRHIVFTACWSFALWGLFACEEPVDLDIELPDQRLVVNANLLPGELVRVTVSVSNNVLAESTKVSLREASVAVYLGDEIVEVLTYQEGAEEESYYESIDFRPAIGVAYTIEVTHPAFPPAYAISIIPESTSVDSLLINRLMYTVLTPIRSQIDFDVRIIYADNPDQTNYYRLRCHQLIRNFHVQSSGDTIFSEVSTRQIKFSPDIDDTWITSAATGSVLLKDLPRPEGVSVPVSLEINPNRELLGRFQVELATVSKSYYDFYVSLSRQGGPAGGLTQTPSIEGNVSNGHGVVTGENSSTYGVEVR
ncbi:MAG: DUF4249 domain-containing protein [Saprospiraceae bacterium]